VPQHAAMAIANATLRLLEDDDSCTPQAPAGFRRRLESLAERWIRANPVTALMDAMTDAKLQGAITGISPAVARVGDTVTLELNAAGSESRDNLIAMFCPHQPAKIISSLERSIQLEVPDRAQSGPVAVVRRPPQQTLDDISSLQQSFQNDYPIEWMLSAFTLMPLYMWAYPVAFSQSARIDVLQVPHSATVEVFDSSGRRAEGKTFRIYEEVVIRYRVSPPGSEANAALVVKATGGKVIEPTEPGIIRYRPTEQGSGSIQLNWGSLVKNVAITGKIHPRNPPFKWSVSPTRLFLTPGGPSEEFQIMVNVLDAQHDLTFNVHSKNDVAIVNATAILPHGAWSVNVVVSLSPGSHATAINQPSDFIGITFGASTQQVEVWVAEPQGRWDPPLDKALSIVGVHAAVLHTGKVLYFSFDSRAVNNKDNFNQFFANPNLGSYQIWDPANETATPVESVGRNIFCGGQCALPDGTIFVAGGQDGAGAADVTGNWGALFAAALGSDSGAQQDVNSYDPVQNTWTRWPDMNDGRYYPTVQALGDGTVFIAGGLSNLQRFIISGSNWCQNDQYEIYDSFDLGMGPSPHQQFRSADQYPIVRLLPGTRQLFVHIHRTTYLFDLLSSSFVSGAQFIPPAPVGRQTYPMQTGHVLLPQRETDTPRILIVGGSTQTGFDYNTGSDAPAVRGAFIFDYNVNSPQNSSWRNTAGLPTVARLLSDTVLLPDGTVFVVNGISKGAAAGHSSGTVFQADLFDPTVETFTPMAAPSKDHPRAYHSTAILLPDGRVAIAGNMGEYNNADTGGPPPFDDTSIQVFNPPYLFRGPRPTVRGIPANVLYKQSITFQNTTDPIVERVMMMRPCAVTHTVDMDQRAIWLATSTTRTGQGDKPDDMFTFTLPTDTSLAPPGPYMLFFLSGAGVPSKASFVFLTPRSGGGGCWRPPVNLGQYVDGAIVGPVSYDSDIVLFKIDQHCNVQLESTCGAITIQQKCDQHCWVSLKAGTTVTIGQKVDQHCIVNIEADGDVTIGQKIDQHSDVTIKSHNGSINIGQKIDGNSSATLIAPNGTITISQKVDGNSIGRGFHDGGMSKSKRPGPGSRRRDPRRESYWRECLRRQSQSGLTVRSFCERESLKESAFCFLAAGDSASAPQADTDTGVCRGTRRADAQ
jgi:hypothetical protein